jgi:hypothetical protein
MKGSQICLFPSSSPPSQSLIDLYAIYSIKLIWISRSNHNRSFIDHGSFGSITVTSFSPSFSDILHLLPSYLVSSVQYIRSYIEYSSILICSIPSCVNLIAILGDTHHLPGMMSYAFSYLQANPPYRLTSYANPLDAVILGSLLNLPPTSIAAYPFAQIILNTIGSFPPPSSYVCKRTRLVGLCSALSLFQLPRAEAVRRVCHDPLLLSTFFLHPFYLDSSQYRNVLLSFYSYIVPTNGSQISPQVLAASALGCRVYTDCLNQLSFHPQFSCLHDSVQHLDYIQLHSPLKLTDSEPSIPVHSCLFDLSVNSEPVLTDPILSSHLSIDIKSLDLDDTHDSFPKLFRSFDSLILLRSTRLILHSYLDSIPLAFLNDKYVRLFAFSRGLVRSPL